jgi:hypothetical protein
MEVDVVLNAELEETIAGCTVICPTVEALWARLDLPEDKDTKAAVTNKLLALQVSLAESVADVRASAAHSTHMKQVAIARRDALQLEIDSHLKQNATPGQLALTETLSYETADRKRATAVEAARQWRSRDAAKKEAVDQEVRAFHEAASQAIAALQKQQEAVLARAEAHRELWYGINEKAETAHAARIDELQNAMATAAKPFIAMGHAAATTETIADQRVEQLQQALAEAQKMISEQQLAMTVAAEKYDPMQIRITNLSSQVTEPLSVVLERNIPALSQEEVQSRMALKNAANVKEELGTEGKGMGKGNLQLDGLNY